MSDLGLSHLHRPRADANHRSRPGSARLDRRLGQAIALSDYGAVLLLCMACDIVYHLLAYGTPGSVYGMRFAALAALCYTALHTLRDGYALSNLLRRRYGLPDFTVLWLATLALDLVALFLLGQGGELSRGITLVALLGGIVLLPPFHRLQGLVARRAVRRHGVRARAMVLVGREADVSRYLAIARPEAHGMLAKGAVYLPDADHGSPRLWHAGRPRIVETSLPGALDDVRDLGIDDVVLVLAWHETEMLEEMVAALLQLPASLYIAPDPTLQETLERRVSPLARMRTFDTPSGVMGLHVLHRPFTLLDRWVKRGFDLALAGLGLLVLAPFLGLVALLVRLDSPGPALYRQTRGGFNERPFRIYKFRSMTHAPERGFAQARAGDARVTRIGRVLRRTNIDELPQLFNVLLGQMSIVGPRPHAADHNTSIADQIANYACRHHVKPGITGWAQVHGLRGGTDGEAMRLRVAHDLYYIQNWSLWLDIRIVLATIFSAGAYRNAY